MKFVDEAVIQLKAGDGGNGCVSFRREKYVPRGGPNGGNGGRGGDVYFQATSNLSTLMDFQYRRLIKAGKGQNGMGSEKDGRSGEDVIVPVPLGTMIYDDETSEVICDLIAEGEKVLVAKGGRGGKGNKHFVSSIHQTPRFAQEGEKGEEKKVRLELKLLADVGLVGLPNAGKSTFLSVVSNAHPKIADYPFTTLTPALGVVQYKDAESFVIADLPGLIEGAHDGKGMGDKFLKHCERTKIYLHLVSLPPEENLSPWERFEMIEKELIGFDEKFKEKRKLVLLTKCELISEEEQNEIIAEFLSQKIQTIPISSVTRKNIDVVLQKLSHLLGRKSLYEV